ncbi:MAG: phage head closure protein [Pseudomonadota bacterium]
MSRTAIGALRHRITIEEPLRTTIEGGAATESWRTVAKVFAKIIPQSGRDVVEGDRVVGRTTHQVTLRYRSNVTRHQRIGFEGRYLDIVSVRDVDSRNRWLICECMERTP